MVDNPFGYANKYPSKPNGEIYTLPANPNTDNRFDSEQEVINNGDGSFRFENDNEVEFSILTSALFNADSIIDDHGDLDPDQGGRGYMMNTKDWRDVEIDFVYFVEDYSDDDGLYVFVGGGRHANPQPFCEGCAYIFKDIWSGAIQVLKEQWHNFKAPVPHEDSYITYPPDPQGGVPLDYRNGIIYGALSDARGQQTAMKYVRYNVKQNDGKSAVKLEWYINANGDKKTWTMLTELLDVSGWGADGAECGGRADQVLNWGFPYVRFYWKNADRINWSSLHVREIQPTAPPVVDPDDNTGGGGTGGQPTVPPAEIPTGKVSKIGSFRFAIASTLATSCDGTDPVNPPTTPPSDPNPPPPGGTNPPPPAGGTISFKMAEYFKVGS